MMALMRIILRLLIFLIRIVVLAMLRFAPAPGGHVAGASPPAVRVAHVPAMRLAAAVLMMRGVIGSS